MNDGYMPRLWVSHILVNLMMDGKDYCLWLKIEVVDHPNYRTINVSGVICSHQPMSFELILFSEECLT